MYSERDLFAGLHQTTLLRSDLCFVLMFVLRSSSSVPRFCDAHQFEKPNDDRALNLMNRCAVEVCCDQGCYRRMIRAVIRDEECVHVLSLLACRFLLRSNLPDLLTFFTR